VPSVAGSAPDEIRTTSSKSAGRDIVERAVEAGLGSVLAVRAALAVTFVTALSSRLEQRREKWFTNLAEAVDQLRQRQDDPDFETVADDDRFANAVMTAIRTVEHAHQQEKVITLGNAVLNSVAPDAPDADTQAIFIGSVKRFTLPRKSMACATTRCSASSPIASASRPVSLSGA
jgi:hypothetical protein